MSPHLSPIAQSQRIISLDVLRGFAVLGILTMNISGFSMPAAAYFDPTVYADQEGLDRWIWYATHLLADMKFMAIFSMLFGAGIVVMSDRCRASGRRSAGLHYRRMGWLIVFGLLHAHLLWYGDVLFWYGACGLVVYLLRNLAPPLLITLGIVSIGMTSGIMFLSGFTTAYWPPEMLEFVIAELKPSSSAIAEEISAYQGGWLEQMSERVPKSLEMQTNTFLAWAAWRVTGLMLLGMGCYKLGIFSAHRSRGFYLTLIAAALFMGIPGVMYGVHHNDVRQWEAPGYFFLGMQFNYWASILVALGWVGVVMIACKSERLRFVTQPLAAVGQTAFSNYVLQTIICTTIFYGHGFGLFGEVDRAGQGAIVLVIWACQIIASSLWLRAFRFGPLEWLWRSLVYLEVQPFRRVPRS